jgi:hypothetical protein
MLDADYKWLSLEAEDGIRQARNNLPSPKRTHQAGLFRRNAARFWQWLHGWVKGPDRR